MEDLITTLGVPKERVVVESYGQIIKLIQIGGMQTPSVPFELSDFMRHLALPAVALSIGWTKPTQERTPLSGPSRAIRYCGTSKETRVIARSCAR